MFAFLIDPMRVNCSVSSILKEYPVAVEAETAAFLKAKNSSMLLPVNVCILRNVLPASRETCPSVKTLSKHRMPACIEHNRFCACATLSHRATFLTAIRTNKMKWQEH
jgi:uncharacterized protein YaaQ